MSAGLTVTALHTIPRVIAAGAGRLRCRRKLPRIFQPSFRVEGRRPGAAPAVQWEISSGMGEWVRSDRVTPPSTISLARAWL